MTNTNTNSAPGNEKKISTQKIKFTDYAIEKFQPSPFEWLTKEGKERDRRRYSLDVSRNSTLKGLRLTVFKKSGKKIFTLMYTKITDVNGVKKYMSLPVTIGEFIPGKFGTKECETKVFELVKKHTNDNRKWIDDPKKAIADENNKIYEANKIKLEKKSIREGIEWIVEHEFPAIKSSGSLVSSTIKSHGLSLYGYNKRTLCMYYSDDDKGHGHIHYKGNAFYGVGKPDGAKDLFKKFPSGHGIITGNKKGKRYSAKYKNKADEISLYDHDLSKHLIENIKPEHIRDYINEKDRTFSTRRNIKRAITYFFNIAMEQGWVPGDRFNPTKNIVIKSPDEITHKVATYNNRRFDAQQLEVIFKELINQQTTYPFQSMALALAEVTGVRIETILKIKRKYINSKEGFIYLPPGITKTKKGMKVTITPVVGWIIKNIDEILKLPKYQKYKFIPWLFPSTKVKSKLIYDNEYIHTDGTRLKDCRSCWKAVCEATGIEGSPKMFRKSYISISKLILKDTFKVMFLSGHTKEATIDVHYNKSTDDQTKQYANEVSNKIFNFNK